MKRKLLKIAEKVTGSLNDSFTCRIIEEKINSDAADYYRNLYEMNYLTFTQGISSGCSENESDLWFDKESIQLRRQLMVLLFAESLGDV